MENKPSYYAIIPANVRYDNDLSPNSKLLYGEITSLCNDKGFCWATNQYFSNLYGVSERTIQNLIKQLVDKKYIKIEMINNTRRLIYIEFTRGEKNFTPGTKKFSSPYEKNFTHNNKMNNKDNNMNEKEINKESDCLITDEFITDALNCNWL